MNTSDLERATTLNFRLKGVDEQLKEIGTLAEIMGNNNCSIKLNLSITDFDKLDKAEKDNVLDRDGCLKSPEQENLNNSAMGSMGMFFKMIKNASQRAINDSMQPPTGSVIPTNTYDRIIQDSVGLKMLGVIASELIQERDNIVSSLNKMGIKIK